MQLIPSGVINISDNAFQLQKTERKEISVFANVLCYCKQELFPTCTTIFRKSSHWAINHYFVLLHTLLGGADCLLNTSYKAAVRSIAHPASRGWQNLCGDFQPPLLSALTAVLAGN